MQTCSKCKKEKELDQFYKGNKKNGTVSACKECMRLVSAARSYAGRRRNPEKEMLSRSKSNARIAGVDFNITVEDCTIPEFCPVLGIPMVSSSPRVNGNINPNSPSLDRLIPSKGYTKGNVRVISWRANSLKGNGTLQELESICKYMRESQC